MRRAILVISLLGTALFGVGLTVSLISPLTIERLAREIVRLEVEERVGEKVETLSNSRIAGYAQKVLQKTEAEMQQTREAIRQELPRKVAEVVANMLNADCECRSRLVERMQHAEDERLSSLTQLRERLGTMIESAYAAVATSLIREFRIFCGSNAVAFALLGVATLIRRRATLQLLLPAVVALGAVGITGGLYLFKQNWLHTVVFGQYVGFGYSLYLAGVALLLADVVFNRARITTEMVNVVLKAVGSAAAAPC